MGPMTPAKAYGLLRSLAMYYGVPGRGRRLERFYSELLPPNALCFDVGAHVGNRVRAWRRLGARVVALEPQADFARLLVRFFGADPAVTVVEAAVGREPGRAPLHVSARTPTVSTLSADWIATVRHDPSFSRVRWSSGETVEVTTLDRLIERFGRPDFVKIDVEGYEAEVLAGLSTPVPALSFEYVAAARGIALECVERLGALGRYVFNFSPGERHVLGASEWLDADGIRAFLENLPDGPGSGDVYARAIDARAADGAVSASRAAS